jgi:hypothetical protein
MLHRRPSLTLLSLLTVLGGLALLAACAEDIEGNQPGECSDGADNDSDSYFDCNDSDCYGAPNCLGEGDDDDAADDDDASDDDDAADDDDGSDDDDATDDDDASDDDDTSDGVTPYISSVTYVYDSSVPKLVFTLEAHDPDAAFGVPLLLWSVDGAPQAPSNVGSNPIGADVVFDVELHNVSPGATYSVLFAIQDADGNQSEGYLISATAS